MKEAKQENPKTNSKFHGFLPTPDCLQTACCGWTPSTIFTSLGHVGIMRKITSMTIIMPAFLCQRVWTQMPYTIIRTSHWLSTEYAVWSEFGSVLLCSPAYCMLVAMCWLAWATLLSLLCSIWKNIVKLLNLCIL